MPKHHTKSSAKNKADDFIVELPYRRVFTRCPYCYAKLEFRIPLGEEPKRWYYCDEGCRERFKELQRENARAERRERKIRARTGGLNK